MRLRWLIPIGAVLCLSFSASGGAPDVPKSAAGFLLFSQNEARPYEPRPGDIILYDSYNKLHHFAFKIAKTGAPIHAAMVIAREDGTPVLLELTGPTIIAAKVCILDVEPRLSTYDGTIMVRRIREPLSTEQCDELICFARSHVGKSFAIGRILLQGTPFNAHYGLRRTLFGKTYFNRNRWYCSEIVVAAGTKAHLFDPETMPANATFPRDLAFDDRTDLSGLYHPPVPWAAEPAPTK